MKVSNMSLKLITCDKSSNMLISTNILFIIYTVTIPTKNRKEYSIPKEWSTFFNFLVFITSGIIIFLVLKLLSRLVSILIFYCFHTLFFCSSLFHLLNTLTILEIHQMFNILFFFTVVSDKMFEFQEKSL